MAASRFAQTIAKKKEKEKMFKIQYQQNIESEQEAVEISKTI